jgi:phosphotransferase system  glucose/maltose/N-acetylglucosamine-specific IIC component/phosphotransferase system IIB component
MRRWNLLVEMAYFPIEVLYIASIVIGLSGLIFNPSFQVYFNITQPMVLRFFDMVRYLASWIILYFPLIFILRGVYSRKDDGMVVLAGLLAYISFHGGMMFFGPNLPIPEAYMNVLGLQANASALSTSTAGTLQVLQTGLLSAFVVIPITRFFVRESKKRSPYSLFNYLNKTVYVVLGSISVSLIAGIALAFIWPSVINFIHSSFRLIAQDLNNPANLFVYGLLNRTLHVLGFGNWMNQVFWFSDLGGTWTGPNGSVYFGDIAIWMAQSSRNIVGFGAGKLITPYYVLNIFAMPAFILASVQTYTDRLVRKRLISFVIIAMISSAFLGTLLPLEIFMMFTTPLVFVFHVVYSAFLFSVLPILGITIGYNHSLLAQVATPGSLMDLIVLIRNPIYQRPLIILVFVGAISFLLYYAFTSYYYRKGSISMIVPQEKSLVLDELIASMGGEGNIKIANASINKVIIQVNDRSLVDFTKINHRASKIVESRAGYAISYGASSYIIHLELIERIQQHGLQKVA